MLVTPLLIALALRVAPPPKVDCEGMGQKVADACAASCQDKRQHRSSEAKDCDAQCDRIAKDFQDRCRGKKHPREEKRR